MVSPCRLAPWLRPLASCSSASQKVTMYRRSRILLVTQMDDVSTISSWPLCFRFSLAYPLRSLTLADASRLLAMVDGAAVSGAEVRADVHLATLESRVICGAPNLSLDNNVGA